MVWVNVGYQGWVKGLVIEANSKASSRLKMPRVKQAPFSPTTSP